MEIKGKAADRGDGKVKIESKVGTTGSETAKTTTEMKGDMSGMHLLGVKSVKRLSIVLHVGSCGAELCLRPTAVDPAEIVLRNGSPP